MKPYTVAFVTGEMMIPELKRFACNGNFRGGLGDLAGHIPDGMAKSGVEVLPITYFYPIDWQTREAINYRHTPACRLFELAVDIHWNRKTVSVFGIARGKSWVYGVNDPDAGCLYPGEKAKKLEQAAFLGRAVPALLKRLGKKPDIVWCQEWMTGLVIPNMRDDPYFYGTKYLFTLHTPAREALEEFPAEWYGSMALDEKYRSVYTRGEGKIIDISSASVELAHLVTGVSEENGEMLQAMFPEKAREGKIFGIMNGVSRDFMLSPRVKALVSFAPRSLWEAHLGDKEEILALIREKTGRMLNPREPLIGLVRRLAEYKNQKPMFESIVGAVCADRDESVGGKKGLAANLFIGGVAHESDTKCGPWMREFTKWMSDPRLKGRFIYLPEYSERLRTLAVRGSDIWVSCPWKRMEACGTSDFGAKMNGNVNVATCGGGIREHGEEIDALAGTGDTLFIEPYNPEMLYLQLKRATGWFYDFSEGRSDVWPRLRVNNFLRGADLDVSQMIEKYKKLCFEPLVNAQ